jgi:hypothetical protein
MSAVLHGRSGRIAAREPALLAVGTTPGATASIPSPRFSGGAFVEERDDPIGSIIQEL